MRNSRYGYLLAVLWILALDGTLAWWVKGDLEMAWLAGIPVILAGGIVVGAAPAIAFRQWKPALICIGLSTLLSTLLLYAALATPHRWPSPPPAGFVDAAHRFASDRAAVKSAVEKVTGYPVEPGIPGKVEITNSFITKQGFSFSLSRTPAAARVVLSFEAGPAEAMQFDVIGSSGSVTLRPRRSDIDRIMIRSTVFERRFPDSSVIEVGGNGPYSRGQTLAVRTARSDTEWSIVLLRVMEENQTLREVRRYSRDELLSRFRKAVAEAGLAPLQSVLIYFRPVRRREVMFAESPGFRFMGVLGNPRYWHAEFVTRLSHDGNDIDFEIGRKLVRPRPGTISARDAR